MRIAAWLGVVGLVGGSVAYAATDGTLGTTSAGTAEITLDIQEQALISGLADFAFGTYDPTTAGDLEITNSGVCVYAQGPGGGNSYDVTLESANGGQTGLYMANANLDTLDYQVYWTAGANPEQEIFAGVNTNNYAGAGSTDCSGVGDPTVSIRVLVTSANLSVAPSGSYSDTLTITIDPV